MQIPVMVSGRVAESVFLMWPLWPTNLKCPYYYVGPNMYIKSDSNDKRITSNIGELMKVKVSDFDVVKLGEIRSYD